METRTMDEINELICRGKEYVASGKGSFTSFARENGITKSVYFRWLHNYGGVSKKNRPSNLSEADGGQGMVFVGRNALVEAPRIDVDFHGATIRADGIESLACILKAVMQVSGC